MGTVFPLAHLLLVGFGVGEECGDVEHDLRVPKLCVHTVLPSCVSYKRQRAWIYISYSLKQGTSYSSKLQKHTLGWKVHDNVYVKVKIAFVHGAWLQKVHSN